jgi:hypothetical protein
MTFWEGEAFFAVVLRFPNKIGRTDRSSPTLSPSGLIG